MIFFKEKKKEKKKKIKLKRKKEFGDGWIDGMPLNVIFYHLFIDLFYYINGIKSIMFLRIEKFLKRSF